MLFKIVSPLPGLVTCLIRIHVFIQQIFLELLLHARVCWELDVKVVSVINTVPGHMETLSSGGDKQIKRENRQIDKLIANCDEC